MLEPQIKIFVNSSYDPFILRITSPIQHFTAVSSVPAHLILSIWYEYAKKESLIL